MHHSLKAKIERPIQTAGAYTLLPWRAVGSVGRAARRASASTAGPTDRAHRPRCRQPREQQQPMSKVPAIPRRLPPATLKGMSPFARRASSETCCRSCCLAAVSLTKTRSILTNYSCTVALPACARAPRACPPRNGQTSARPRHRGAALVRWVGMVEGWHQGLAQSRRPAQD